MNQSDATLLKAVRSVEKTCEIDDKFGVLDFSIKSKNRKLNETDLNFFDYKDDLTVWANCRIGNSLLLEYDLDEDSRIVNVSLLRQGLSKMYNLHMDAIN